MGSSITKHVAGSETSGSEQGDCDYCQRRGLPIFPVRYAVCQRTDANEGIPELSEDRVSAFTDIKLDQTLDDGETNTRVVPEVVKAKIPHSTSSQVNKYILRQLRSGYLYLFDKDNTDGIYWHGFAITSDGKYYKFPVKQPPALDKISFPCALSKDEQQEGEEETQRKTSEAMHASIVTLPEPSKSGNVYYAYTEFAWPEDFLDEVEEKILSGDAWCDKYLQKLNIPSWDSGSEQTHAFAIDEFQNVAEFSDGAEGVKSHFLTSGDSRELYTREDMEDAMGSSPRYEGRGLILAVNDEIGIVQELNAYRQEALAPIENFFNPKEDGERSRKLGEERRRMLLCKQAIESFQQNFDYSYRASEENYAQQKIDDAKNKKNNFLKRYSKIDLSSKADNLWADREKQRYIDNLEALDKDVAEAEADLSFRHKYNNMQKEKKQLLRVKIKHLESKYTQLLAVDGPEGSETTYLLGRRISRLKWDLAHKYDDLSDKVVRKHKVQLYDAFSIDKLSSFEAAFLKQAGYCRTLMYVNDCDYSIWLRIALRNTIERCSQKNIYSGLSLTAVMTDVLQGSILSPASASVWKQLSDDMRANNSAITSIIFLNNKDFCDAAFKQVSGLAENQHLGLSDLVIWAEEFAKFKRSSMPLTSMNLDSKAFSLEIKSVTTVLAVLIGNSLSALRMHSIKYNLNKDADSKANQKLSLKLLINYQLALYMSDYSSQVGNARIPVMKNFEIKISDYYNSMKSLAESTETNGGGISKAFKSVKDNFGNFSTAMGNSDKKLKLALPDMQIITDKNAKTKSQLSFVDSFDYSDKKSLYETEASVYNETMRKIKEALGQDFGAGGVRGNIIIQFLCIYELYHATDFDELFEVNSQEDVSKLIGFSASFSINSMNSISSIKKIRPTFISRLNTSSNAWRIANKSAAAISGAMALYDGCQKFLDSKKAEKMGHSIEANNLKVMGGVTAVGGVITIYAALFAGPIFGLAATVVIGFITLVIAAFWVTLIADSVQTWINRSLLGVNEIQLNKFTSIEEEQNSLEMVFAGIVVDFYWDKEGDYSSSDSGALFYASYGGSVYSYSLKVSVALPKINGFVFRIALYANDIATQIFNWQYQKSQKEKEVQNITSTGNIVQGGATQPNLIESDTGYLFSLEKVVSMSSFGKTFSLTVEYLDKNSLDLKNDSFELEVDYV